MKKVVFGIIAGLALGAGATWVALPHAATAEPAKAEAAAPAEKPKENPLHLNAAKRAATGVTLAKPTSATLAPEVNAFGRVLDPSPFIALVAEFETAQAALVASEKDAARVQRPPPPPRATARPLLPPALGSSPAGAGGWPTPPRRKASWPNSSRARRSCASTPCPATCRRPI